MSNYTITAEDGTFWVWEPSLDMPWVDFPTKEEFDGKVAEYGILSSEAKHAIQVSLNSV